MTALPQRLRGWAAGGGRHAAKVTERAVVDFFADRCTQLAAAMSYYALLALFPLAILAVGVFGLVIGEEQARDDVIDFLTRRLPVTEDAGRQDIASLLRGVVGSGGTIQALGAIGLLISATGLMGALRNALNTAFGVEERRPPLRGKAVDVLLVVGVGMVVAISFALTVGRQLIADLGGEVGGPVETATGLLAGTGSWALPLAISLAVFTLLYRFIPATGVRWTHAATGGLVATAGYELAKRGFSFYLDNFADYGAVYGALGAVIAFMFFVFLVANVFLLGAEVVAEIPRVLAGRYYGGPPDDRSFARQVLDAAKQLVVDVEDREAERRAEHDERPADSG
ncbi:MAG: YihY/virulence factor BrkB family protein [Solirubrobacterales bacterium]|nr:YihY/virulence factor BrkB family protein [Solirubrobacterales bacterium]